MWRLDPRQDVSRSGESIQVLKCDWTDLFEIGNSSKPKKRRDVAKGLDLGDKSLFCLIMVVSWWIVSTWLINLIMVLQHGSWLDYGCFNIFLVGWSFWLLNTLGCRISAFGEEQSQGVLLINRCTKVAQAFWTRLLYTSIWACWKSHVTLQMILVSLYICIYGYIKIP